MYRTILVPLDGSTLAERALTIALPLAERHGATLVLAAVHEPVLPAVPSSGVALYDTALDTEERVRLQRHLARMAARVRKLGPVTVETIFREGRVVPTLLALIRERRVELTVLCTHGRGGFQRMWLGSVADGVLRGAPTPLLLVRGGRVPMPAPGATLGRRVVVALDGSPRAEEAVGAVERFLGLPPAGELVLAHVVHPLVMAVAMRSARRPDAEFVERYLEPIVERLRAGGRTARSAMATDANVARALLALAAEAEADLLAITPQGLRAMERALVGSVADKLIRTASIPVLVVPSEERRE
ncbi:MAG: universal stress protein [Gemmatimonadota bacterium]|nr:universal stress protein [Gemmatimonadota bacterium]MDQ8147524.1 universal stress protein [Gemmatimonadota bacterium]MDQ8149297.1 universal stress protein [Gemmatimonadota bacterium]MDQ8170907.1 universal stress protein [Gemmatimonadota bacterium]MDQ8176930.1 universal stress protein [Gemmatimonadota bacterium]